jgi:hypothetical protein
MNEARELLKIARDIVAGVNVSIDGLDPLNMSEILYRHVIKPVAKAMGSDWDLMKATYDGDTNPYAFTGTLNIYVGDDEKQQAKVLQALRKVYHELERDKGVKVAIKRDISRMTGGPVYRFIIRANPEAKYEKMGQTDVSMTYTTWMQILKAAGLENLDEQAGSMSLREMQRALETAVSGDPKVDRFLSVVLKMTKIGQKLGYKDMMWG